MFVLYDHLGSSSSTPTIQYDSKEEVGAAKSEESPIPTTHSSVVIDGKNFFPHQFSNLACSH